ncbi:hypothetical protein [Microlunatus ginsengisoli]|uniref:Uncharacterized protein n=1 Tax=Microlunatus ginsengisoli TaxID=363863 RepID=A0ABP7AZI6_9ACTN
MAFNVCDGRPEELARGVLCLDELSKDVKGELTIIDLDDHSCKKLDCRTRVVEHLLRAEVTSHRCDSELGKLFDGQLIIRDLTTVFAGGSGLRRGIHAARFQLRTAIGIVSGRMSGMTNEGTHREPAFKGCQECGDVGVMEGQMCGRVSRAKDPAMRGLQLTAAYRFAFEPDEKGGNGGLAGTIEGVVVRTCDTTKDCLMFAVVDTSTNPRVAGALTIETRDTTGPTADTSVANWASVTGLRLWHSSTIKLAVPASSVEITLARFATPATVTAFDAAGGVVATATMAAPQQVPETLVLSAPGIVELLVESPSDEILMPQICWVSQN